MSKRQPKRLNVAVNTLVVLIGIVAGGGCGGRDMPETVNVSIGAQAFTLEVAATMDQQRKGLMYRDHLAADSGDDLCV